MNEPQFDSPLDDALDDFRLSMEAGASYKDARQHLTIGLGKLVQYTRDLEARVAALERR